MADEFTAIVGRLIDLDPRLSLMDLEVLALIQRHPTVTTLDGLCKLTDRQRRYVFGAVAQLEDAGFLTPGVIR